MNPISVDLRKRVIVAYDADQGQTQEALSQRFMISQSSVSRILAKYRKNESLVAGKQSGRPRILSQAELDFLKSTLVEKNDMTLEEQANELEKQRSIKVSAMTICRALKRMKLTRKKRPATIRLETAKRTRFVEKNSKNG